MYETALLLGASGGIGQALLAALETAGARVTGLSRADGLDWATPKVAEHLLATCGGPFDLVFDATGALQIGDHQPEKKLASIDADAMADQFKVNSIGPALIFKYYESLLPRDRASVIATLSARVGSIGDNGLGGWISYRASKAALNQVVRTAAIEIARKRPKAVCVALHPGTVRTRLSTPITGPDSPGTLSTDEAAKRLLRVLSELRPADTGSFFAYDGSQIPW
ncbi:MAG: SDR family NAD(P)-dependent oxidoreductase [Pseudomonadota bacterium]